jgi:hypothetical protein
MNIGVSVPYFFLYPAGQVGLIAVTNFVVLALMQVIVDFIGCLGVATGAWVDGAATGAS